MHTLTSKFVLSKITVCMKIYEYNKQGLEQVFFLNELSSPHINNVAKKLSKIYKASRVFVHVSDEIYFALRVIVILCAC